MVQDISAEEVDRIITQAKLVFLDCWAPWCKPCRDLAPILSELEEKYTNNENISFFKINVDEYPEFSKKYRIRAIPCVLIYYEGTPKEIEDPDYGLRKTDRLLGRRGPEAYESVIKQLLP